ncbi:hypothetical protein VNO77_40692 [Canavalia gladiata]|uniref:Uncharacterized protein n=1 Tax=Canavalia gladiata TaxID=3824 RepID=A0AAN9K0D2_CANGL
MGTRARGDDGKGNKGRGLLCWWVQSFRNSTPRRPEEQDTTIEAGAEVGVLAGDHHTWWWLEQIFCRCLAGIGWPRVVVNVKVIDGPAMVVGGFTALGYPIPGKDLSSGIGENGTRGLE